MVANMVPGQANYQMKPDKYKRWDWRRWGNLPKPLMPELQQLVDQDLNLF